MIDDVFVFDGVAHMFNFDPKNAFGPPGLMFDQHLYAFHNVLTQVEDQIRGAPGIREADVSIVWDEAWTTDRLSERAARLLRFLPSPAQAGDRDAYLAAHQPGRGDQHDR